MEKRHTIFMKAYENLKQINKINTPAIVLANFADFYLNYWRVIEELNKKNINNQVVKEIITKYNERKKEVDAILDQYKSRNIILEGLKKTNPNNENKAKNLANKAEKNIETIVKINNNVETNKIYEEYQKKISNNKYLKNLYNQSPEKLLLNERAKLILNKKASELKELEALELKAKLVNLSKEEKNKIKQLQLNNFAANLSNMQLQSK